MRRLIGYIAASVSMLLAVGVAATPVITSLSTGREYTDSRNYREIVFNVEENATNGDNKNRASVVADEMRQRLSNYNVEDYSIKVQGEDKVAVSLNMDKKEFNYTAKYLCFSGESFAFVSSTKSDSSIKNEHKLFNPEDVKIEYQGDAKVPVIIIPLTSEGITDLKALLSEFEPTSENTDEENEPNDVIYLWANLDEENGESLDSLEYDPIARDKVLMAFGKDSIWNPNSDEEETELYYMCAEAKADNENELDISGLKDFNDRALYLQNMLKANEYDFEISCPSALVNKTPDADKFSVDYYTKARVLNASAEKLFGLDADSIINVKSKTFVASVVAVVIISLLLVIFYRLSALAMISTTIATLFITLISFMKMGVLFNVPAVIGLLTLSASILFGQIIYGSKLKDEIYKGRTIKKANQEAAKKSNLLITDASVITAFSGLMMYAIGDSALKPVGVALFFGSIFALLMNLLVFKFLMYLLTNSTNVQNKYYLFNIEKNNIPNLMSTEDKVSHESPYEKVDFTKKKKLLSIIFGGLSVVALASIIVFAAISPTHSPLNVTEAVKETTVCYVSIDVTDNDNPVIKDGDVESFRNYALKDVDLTVEDKDIDMQKISVYSKDGEVEKTTETYFVSLQNVVLGEEEADEIETAIVNNINEFMANDNNTVSIRTSNELIYTPSQGLVALATGLSIVGAAIYIAFRFRPSKGLAVFVTSTASTMIGYGIIVGLHFIGTTALTSVAMPLIAVTSLLGSLFYLSTEKAMKKEYHDVLDEKARNEIMIKALGKSAAPMMLFMLCNVYIAINFFGFGLQSTVVLFGSVLIGEAVSILALLSLVGPLSELIGKGLAKVKLPKLPFLNKGNKSKVTQVKKTSEPEETIFIGIND